MLQNGKIDTIVNAAKPTLMESNQEAKNVLKITDN